MVSTKIPVESSEMNESTGILMVSTGIPVKKIPCSFILHYTF